jgi:flagellar hook assembly protein FlgD
VQPPVRFALEQNFPNPFNPSTTIRYQVGKDAQGVATQVVVFDLLGREIRRLVDARQEPGYYEVVWDGKDEQGRAVPSGVYFVRLRAGDVAMVKRMLLTE